MKRTYLRRKTPVGLKIASGGSKKLKSKKSSPKKKRGLNGATITATFREWGIPDYWPKKNLRYTSPLEKGIAWFWFARYIRARDWKKYGTCISCGAENIYESLQAGHFRPASSCGVLLLMDETNVNGECEKCNGFDPMHLLGYAENLDKRYGPGTSTHLRQPVVFQKDYTKAEYLEKAAHYRSKWEELMA